MYTESLSKLITQKINHSWTLINVIKSIEIELIHGLDEIISQLTKEIDRNREFKNDSVSLTRLQ